ncbi:Site-specific recombinase XerD [Terricaulis silvestris]|uniref:Site-specific recombinase XerD n=2 Tax=Terricaulis silvestris TaxID=2686094 RepID=A0A6I6MLQ0_9CAUL|nr:Site-specific recombinase XerD [Terricaulis silvestris]
MAESLGERPLGIDQFRRLRSVTKRYLIPYFGRYPIDRITRRETIGYAPWRKMYYSNGPGVAETSISYQRNGKVVARPPRKSAAPARSTVAKDVEAFNKIIAFAQAQHQELDWSVVPRLEGVTKGARLPRPRARFKPDQVKLIFQTAIDRAGDPKIDRRPTACYARDITLSLIRFLWTTGARPTEALALRVGDLEFAKAPKGTMIPGIGRLHGNAYVGDWGEPDLDHPQIESVDGMYEYVVALADAEAVAVADVADDAGKGVAGTAGELAFAGIGEGERGDDREEQRGDE